MPPLSQMIRQMPGGYERVQEQSPPSPAQPPVFPQQPNQYLRCPLPPVAITPDSLRQFYHGGEVPQARVLTPTTLSASSGSGNSTTTTIDNSTTTTISTSPTSQTTSIVTPNLNPGDQFTTSITVAKAFTVLRVSVNNAARVELYSTAAAQNQDLARAATFGSVNNPPPAEIQSQVICDLYLDTNDKFSWVPAWSITGVNGDSPQTSTTYATVTNIGAGNTAIVATIAYVPLES